jgi:acyl carrier protein
MEKKDILAKLNVIIHNQLGTEIEAGMETKLAEDLQADSLDKVEMIMAAEDEFGIEIDDDAALSFISVGDVVNYIATKL